MSDLLTVRLGDTLARALKEESTQTGVPQGEIVRQAVKARLGRTRKLSVMRKYHGAISGPTDLSTNKAYRRSWSAKKR